jgi:hypothetical protein
LYRVLHQNSIQILQKYIKICFWKKIKTKFWTFYCSSVKAGPKARFGLRPLAAHADDKVAHGGPAMLRASPHLPPRPQPRPGPTKRGPAWADFGPANLGRQCLLNGHPTV